MKKIIITILLLSFAFISHAEKKALTYKEFGHLPIIQEPTVSPDGKHIAGIFNSADGPSVVMSDFGSSEIVKLVSLKKSKDRIDNVMWANNERLLVSSSYSKKQWGDRFRVNRLFAVNIDGSNLIELNRKASRRNLTGAEVALFDLHSSQEVVSLLKDEKEFVLLQMYSPKDKGQSVYKTNIYENKFEKLFVNKYDVYSWVANKEGHIVLGVGSDDKDSTIRNIWYRKDNNDEWKLLHTKKAFEGESFSPVLVSENKAIVISDHELHRDALWQYDIKTGTYEKLLYANDNYDIDGVIYNADRDDIIGAIYFEHYRKNHFFTDADTQLYNIVKNSFKQYEASIYSMSKDKKKILVAAQRDNSPPKFFWLDLAKKSGGFWISQYPNLEGKPLASVQSFEFEASDGMSLNGYLTLPTSATDKSERPPLIIHPHGGPQSRDYQYFSPFVQYFASKGYAVLQVNFRGSTGFNNAYQTAGYQQWGKRMQDDIYEAIDWLAETDLVDTKNSCIVGASYGGYVALTAAFQRPEQFKCIASIAGIGDLLELANDEYKYEGKRPFIDKTIGNPTDNEVIADLKSTSAINYLNKIKAPILLIHGKHDTQVRFSQSEDFYDAAKSANVDIDFVEFANGTHYLDENENRLEAFKAVGEFLEKHL
jgi:dipeptidyl aminopeptidase/acylaminoacyl peptidase